MLRALLFTLALLLPACGGDGDGDGYTVGNGDCDDDDSLVNPSAQEVCDGIDNDCDGSVDEEAVDALTWYTDSDGDDFGDPTTGFDACNPDAGEIVDNGLDCDDDDPDVNPLSLEYCDGLDNDCNGVDDDEYAEDAPTWYADADLDGYGTPAYTRQACEQPDGYVANDDDCDDSTAEARPGGDEVCDRLDNDCNGEIDDGALDPVTWYHDADGDEYGDPEDTLEVCTGPDDYVLINGDCDDANPAVHPGADEYCNDVDDDCDTEVDESPAVDAPTWYLDYDFDGYGSTAVTREACEQPDGYSANSDDCNDRRADIYPGAPEYCDGDDNNCDGQVDEDSAVDAETWYLDADSDGYGDPASGLLACDRPPGYEDNGEDCDDGDPNVFPGANEYCNGYDDDCDGETDERSALDVTAWYRDDDGDGYGNSAYVTYACDEPEGYGAEFGDCDDTDPDINPGATEVCDYDDNDCDGVVDEDDAADASTWYADGDGDGYGDATVTTLSCSQPSGYVADDADCDDTEATTHPDAEELCNDGVDNNCDGTFGACFQDLDDADVIFVGESYADYAGTAVAAGADLDADGYDDLVIGAEYRDAGSATDAGATYLFWGPVTAGTIDLSAADNILVGEAASDQSATTLSILGDVDADGYADLLAGAKRNAAGIGTATGAAYLFYGPIASTADSLADADVKISGNSAWDFTGIQVEYAGDINDDGYDDVLIAGTADDVYGANAGTIYVERGPIASSMSVNSADYTLGGETAYDTTGRAASAGDVDGDGRDDILVGGPNQDLGGTTTDAGKAYLVYADGLASGNLGSVYDAYFYGADGDRCGSAVGPAGDLDSDGYGDIFVSSTQADVGANNGGAIYVYYGPIASGTYLASTSSSMTFHGEEALGHLGSVVQADYDYDDDGSVDVLASAPDVDTNTGWTYLFLSPSDGTWYSSDADATWRGEESGDSAGVSAAFAGNVEGGTGQDAVLIGAYGNDRGAASSGAAYLVYGLAE